MAVIKLSALLYPAHLYEKQNWIVSKVVCESGDKSNWVEKGAYLSYSHSSQQSSSMAETPNQSMLTDQYFQNKSNRDCMILANWLIIFIGSLQVFSAIWFWAPQLCGKIHRHGDDESHPGDTSETIPRADISRSRSIYRKDA